jgi:hypothetical protein
MGLLTDEEKREIRAKAEAIKNEILKHQEIELQAALRIIEKLLGADWYNKACENNSKLGQDRVGPIAALLMDRPFGKDKIIHFAEFMRVLWGNNTNIENKIDNYMAAREKNGDISLAHFNRLAFELQVASLFKNLGIDVYFLPQQKGKNMKKLPEFKLSSLQGTTYVECKKKDAACDLEKKILTNCQLIEKQLIIKMHELKMNYLVEITIQREIKNSDVPLVIQAVNSVMEKKESCSKQYVGEIVIEVRKLLDFGVRQSSINIPDYQDLQALPNVVYGSADFSFDKGYNVTDPTKFREMRIPIYNYKQVVISSPFPVTKAQSIKLSIKDASDQLLESSGYGTIAIDLSDLTLGSPTNVKKALNFQKDIEAVINTLTDSIKGIPHIGAVFFFITRRDLMDDGRIKRSTKVLMWGNNLAAQKFPSDIAEAFKNGVEIGYKSLLDD